MTILFHAEQPTWAVTAEARADHIALETDTTRAFGAADARAMAKALLAAAEKIDALVGAGR